MMGVNHTCLEQEGGENAHIVGPWGADAPGAVSGCCPGAGAIREHLQPEGDQPAGNNANEYQSGDVCRQSLPFA